MLVLKDDRGSQPETVDCRQRLGAREGTGTGVFSSLSHCLHGRGRVFFLLFVALFVRAGAGVFSSLSHCLHGRGRGVFSSLSHFFHGIGSGVKAIFKGPAGALVVHHKGSI